MDPKYSPDDTLPEPMKIILENHLETRRDTLPCPPPPPSSLSPISYDLAAEYLDEP